MPVKTIIFLVLFVGILACILIINNMDFIKAKSSLPEDEFIDTSWDEEIDLTVDSPKVDEDRPEEKKQKKKKTAANPEKPKPQATPGEPPDKGGFTFTTDKIICPLKEEPLLYVVLQLGLHYSEGALKKELEFKKSDLHAVIQNMIYTSETNEVKAPVLRKKIMDTFNDLLHDGEIQDVTFKDFKIEVRKK